MFNHFIKFQFLLKAWQSLSYPTSYTSRLVLLSAFSFFLCLHTFLYSRASLTLKAVPLVKTSYAFFPPFFFLETREIIALIWDMSVYKQEKCCSVVLWDLGRKVHCVLPASSASGEKCLVQALSSRNVEIT